MFFAKPFHLGVYAKRQNNVVLFKFIIIRPPLRTGPAGVRSGINRKEPAKGLTPMLNLSALSIYH